MKPRLPIIGILAAVLFQSLEVRSDDGVFARFRITEGAPAAWYVKLGGFIHNDPWYLPSAVWPAGADKIATNRIAGGDVSPWFDVAAFAGKRMHGRLSRAGGVAEFPNVTIELVGATNAQTSVVIELATAADEKAVVKSFRETFAGNRTSFLVSPKLKEDAASLESASEMSARRLAWAQEATGGKRYSPTNLWLQTGFWAPQRAELNVQEARTLSLLGFNIVGGQTKEVRELDLFEEPGGHHWINFAPSLSREDIEKQIAGPAAKAHGAAMPVPYNFSDEIVCPAVGSNTVAVANFRAWLKTQKVSPASLGTATLDEVLPIESPAALRERQTANRAAANRTFYWTTKFRQASATQRLKWLTESFHVHAPTNVLTSTLVADHPYFGGSGLGMGMHAENTTWGGFPLSLDWFGLARERVVDVMGIEDWLGLNFMYGPTYTWEGFQLLGFQAAIFRSGSRGAQPIIAWITPSDERNLRLKTASALCQGAKNFYYWTYGPTATSTENYWSDLRGAYDGVAAISRQLAGAEHILGPGQMRQARVAVLYSLSSDLWQPFGYVSMAERRLTYLSLIHDQFLVDFVTEQDIEVGRLKDYRVLYVADPNVTEATCAAITKWVKKGGALYGSAAAASRNEFDEPHDGLSAAFGISTQVAVEAQSGRFDLRGALNDLKWMDQAALADGTSFGALGLKAAISATTAKVAAKFSDGSPAIVSNKFGSGTAWYIATCAGVSYAKDAKFVAAQLKEKWPAMQRGILNTTARGVAQPLVALSYPVVEAGVYDAKAGTALVLANFTYEQIPALTIRLPVKTPPVSVRSLEKGPLAFTVEKAPRELRDEGFKHVVTCTVALGLNDIVLFASDR